MSQNNEPKGARMDAAAAREILRLEQEMRIREEVEKLNDYCRKRGIQLLPLITLGPRGVVQSQIQLVLKDST